MNYIKKIFVKIYAKLWIIFNIKDDSVYFYCPSGIGDTLYVACYMHEYKKNNLGKKVKFIIKKSHKDIVNMYNEIDESIIVKPFVYKVLNSYLLSNLKDENRVIYAHPLKLMYDPTLILGIKNICLLDLYKLLLNISPDSKIMFPHVKKNIRNYLLEKNGMKDGKSILLCPYCVSVSMLDMDFWNSIANKYIKLGYNVYVNVTDGSQNDINGAIPLNLNLLDLFTIIDTFEHVYSMRSGLCDLIAFSKVSMTVFYPFDKSLNRSKAYDIYNFKNIGIRDNIREFIIQPDCLTFEDEL